MLRQLYKHSFLGLFATLILSGLFLLSSNQVAHAATLYISPATTKVDAGNIVSVRVAVSTAGKYINNADGTVLFPVDLLEVVSINKGSSIFTLWVEEPKFSNYEGKVTFDGGVPSPGYAGESGEIVTITFRAKKSGVASVFFSDSAVRENDGLGTDILSGRNPGSITIGAGTGDVTPPPVVPGTPGAPVVTSRTHPESNRWYNTTDAELEWEVPSGITAVSTLIGKSPSSLPTVVYDPPIGNKKITSIDDGVWYFHIRFKNKNGWGAVTHFRMQIDTVPPNQFKITYPEGKTADGPSPVMSFKTTDSLSGMDHYEVKIGNGNFIKVTTQEVSSGLYNIPAQDPGTYGVLVKAVDMAGNETVQTSQFTVSSLTAPRITDYPAEITEGDTLKISGTSYENVDVEVLIADANGRATKQTTTTTANGEFTMVWTKSLSSGTYTLRARAIDSRGAKSDYSKTLSFLVARSSLSSASTTILNWLSIVFIVLIVLAIIAATIMHFIKKAMQLRKVVNRRVKAAEASVHKAFDLLRENVREQIKTLEDARAKRDLTKEEEKVVKRLQDNLTKSEEFIEKQISEIEKTIS